MLGKFLAHHLKAILSLCTVICISACNPLQGISGDSSSVSSDFHPGISSSPPINSLSNFPAAIKGNHQFSIQFTEAPEVVSARLDYSDDGGSTYTLIGTIAPFNTHYLWLTPSAETVLGMVKLTLTDGQGNHTALTSQIFSIDSTPPAAPSVSLSSSDPTNNLTTSITVASCTDRSAIFVSQSASIPSDTTAGWQTCSATIGAIQGTLASGDGAKTEYVFAKDIAGNVSTSTSINLTLDQTAPNAPAVVFTSSATTSSGANSTSLTFTAANCTDTSTLLISEASTTPLSTSPDWQTCSTTAGAITHTLSNTSVGSHALKAWAKDASGNISTPTSLSLIYDVIAPSVSGFTVANGATTLSGVSTTLSFAASDSGSGIALYCLDTNSSFSSQSCSTSAPNLFSLPFSSGTYTVYLKVIDQAGNSTTVNSQAIALVIGTPPILSIVSPTSGAFNSSGAAITIEWKSTLTSSATLKPNGVKIQYVPASTNVPHDWPVVGSYPAGTSLHPTQNNGCTLTGDATGCTTLGLPAAVAGVPFKIVILEEDTAGNISVAISPLVLNGTNSLTLFAGADYSALGGTALATSLSDLKGISRDPTTGDTFALRTHDILIIKGSTGVITRLVGPTGSQAALEYDFTNTCDPTYKCRHALDTDEAGNLYFADASGVLKYNRTSHTIANVVSAAFVQGVMVVNDQIYYATSTPIANLFLGFNVFRYDGVTTTAIAGQDYNQAYTYAAEGADVNTVGIETWTVEKLTNTTVRLWALSGNKLFSVLPNGTVHLENTTTLGGTLGRYLPSRHSLPLMNGNLTLIDVENPSVLGTTIGTYDGDMIDVVDMGAQNIAFFGSNYQIISYVNASNTRETFAGVLPYSGDGDPAIYAQLRAPSEMTWDASGTAYIRDAGNFRFRTIDTSGYIHSASSYQGSVNVFLSSGVPQATPLFSSFRAFSGIFDLTQCLFYCAGYNGTNYIGDLVTGSNPVNYSTETPSNLDWGNRVAHDGSDTYIYSRALGSAGATVLSYVHKIDSGGNIVLVAGDQVHDDGQLLPTAGAPILGSFSGQPGIDSNNFTVAQATLFEITYASPILWSGEVGGNWVAQAANADSFTVNTTNRDLYYLVGKILYRKNYVTDGSGTAVQIADFTGTLNTPLLQSYNQNLPHTLFIADGNSIYKFYDATLVP